MPLYDYECPKCGLKFEAIARFDEEMKCPICFDEVATRLVPQGKSPSFKLTFNPKTDMVDWDGNRSKYWDDWKKVKADGKEKDYYIPEEEGMPRNVRKG